MFENYGGENCLIFFLIKEIVKVSMSRKLSKLWDFNCHPIVRMLYTYFYQPFHSNHLLLLVGIDVYSEKDMHGS